MRRVEELLGDDHATVSWSDSAEVALGRMRALDCHELVVMDPFGVVGLCERSVLLAQQRRGAWLGSIATADLMRRGPFWCRDADAPERAARAMARLGTGTLAVLDRQGGLLGTVRGDRLAAMMIATDRQPVLAAPALADGMAVLG